VAETTPEPERRGLALAELGQGRQAGELLLQAAEHASTMERYDRALWLCERAGRCLDAADVPASDPLRYRLAWRTLIGVGNTWDPKRAMALGESLLRDAATHGWDRARVLSLLAQLHLHAGELDQARERATQALAEPGELTRRLQVLGMVAYTQGDLVLAQDSFERAGALIDDHSSYLWARNLNQLAEIARKRGEYDDALRGYTEAAQVVALLGEHRDVLVSNANIGLVHLGRRDWAAARSVLDEVLTSGTSGLTIVPHCLATVFLLRVSAEQRDAQAFDRMAAGLRRRLRLLRVFDPDMAEQAEHAGAVWMRRGDPHRAAVAWRVALDQFTQLDPARAEQLSKRVT
jgi:tetratricopeptide (TPR) repeat protein